MAEDMSTQYSPYVGPRPFESRDQDRFFGREVETAELLAQIRAHRVVVLYSPSGAGKTSLLNAAIIPLLERDEFEILGPTRVQGISYKSAATVDNPFVASVLFNWAGTLEENSLNVATFSRYFEQYPPLENRFGEPAPRLLIFDQFEELFTGYPENIGARGLFFSQLFDLLDADESIRILFSIREDFLAQLDLYTPIFPGYLHHRYRLNYLNPSQARDAIEKPLIPTGRSYGEGVVNTLIESLREVYIEQGDRVDTVQGPHIEPVQLQIVCKSLWDRFDKQSREIKEINHAIMQQFGTVDSVLIHYYVTTLHGVTRRRWLQPFLIFRLRRWFEQELITPANTRSFIFWDNQSEQVGSLPNEYVDKLMEAQIVRSELRSGSNWVELTHDQLIEPIKRSNLIWRRRTALGLLSLATIFSVIFFFLFIGTGQELVDTNQELQRARNTLALVTKTVAALEVTNEVLVTEVVEVQVSAEAEIVEREVVIDGQVDEIDKLNRTIEVLSDQLTREIIPTPPPQTATPIPTATSIPTPPPSFVRPLHPGLHIGTFDIEPSGSIGGFMRDGGGNQYAFTLKSLLSCDEPLVYQPGPADAQTVGDLPDRRIGIVSPETCDSPIQVQDGPISAVDLVGFIKLDPDQEISVAFPIPDIGPIAGWAEPQPDEWVYMVSWKSNAIARVGPQRTEPTSLTLPGMDMPVDVTGLYELTNLDPSPGNEGAILLNASNQAVGMVISSDPIPLFVPMRDIINSVAQRYQFVRFGSEIATLAGPTEQVRAIEFSQNGEWLVAAGFDGSVFLWETDIDNRFSEAPIQITGHSDGVWTVGFTTDNMTLGTGGLGGQGYLWNLPIENPRVPDIRLNTVPSDIVLLEISPDNQWVSVAGANEFVYYWTLTNPQIRRRLSGHDENISELLFLDDSSALVTTGRDGQVFFRPAELGQITQGERLLPNHRESILTVAGNTSVPGRTHIATGSLDGFVHYWQNPQFPESGSDFFWQTNLNSNVESVAFSRDGIQLAAGDHAGRVHIWRNLNNRNAEVLGSHDGIVRKVSFTADGEWIISASNDGTIHLWDINDRLPNREFLELRGHRGVVNTFALSPTGQFLATASHAGDSSIVEIKIWQVN